MFTGIIQQIGTITSITRHAGHHAIAVQTPAGFLDGVRTGASIAVNGTCLTVTGHTAQQFHVDAVAATLAITTIGLLQPGDAVNLERSAHLGAEIGGHVLSGHVAGMGTIVSLDVQAAAPVLAVRLPAGLVRYVFDKGYLALDGASLTVAALDEGEATVHINLIPETLRQTTFGQRQPGARVNVEIDPQVRALVDTIERTMERLGTRRPTAD